jgi:hypothetical protein
MLKSRVEKLPSSHGTVSLAHDTATPRATAKQEISQPDRFHRPAIVSYGRE